MHQNKQNFEIQFHELNKRTDHNLLPWFAFHSNTSRCQIEERERFKEKWGQRCGPGRWGEHHNWDNYADEPAKTTE